MTENENKQNYIWDWSLVVLALMIVSASGLADRHSIQLCFSESVYWFQRSGSLLVFIAVVLEFRQLICTVEGDSLNSAFGKHIGYLAGRMNTKQKKFQAVAITLSVLGTIIWGYGDLLFKT